jgi:hypothetical protein
MFAAILAPSRYRQRLSVHHSELWARPEGSRVADAMIEARIYVEEFMTGESREMLGRRDKLRYNDLDQSSVTRTRRSSRMRVKLQLVMCSDEGQEETVTDVITLNKNHQRIEHLGLTLAEAKQLLSALQRHLLQHQIDTFLDPCSTCADCGALLKVQAHASRSFRTLFGTCKLYSPRLEHCDCTRRTTSSFRPLSALRTESVAPELLYLY